MNYNPKKRLKSSVEVKCPFLEFMCNPIYLSLLKLTAKIPNKTRNWLKQIIIGTVSRDFWVLGFFIKKLQYNYKKAQFQLQDPETDPDWRFESGSTWIWIRIRNTAAKTSQHLPRPAKRSCLCNQEQLSLIRDSCSWLQRQLNIRSTMYKKIDT